MKISPGKTALLGCGVFGLLGFAVVAAIVARVVWLIVFYPPFTDEEIFKTHLGLDVRHVKDLKAYYYDFNNTATIKVRFEVLDARELDAYLEREGVLLEKSQEEKTSFFNDRTGVKWWAPDKNTPHELYRMKAKFFKKSIRLGNLYFDREKKIVFADFTLLFKESHCKDKE